LHDQGDFPEALGQLADHVAEEDDHLAGIPETVQEVPQRGALG
jgi:hypothetical protein